MPGNSVSVRAGQGDYRLIPLGRRAPGARRPTGLVGMDSERDAHAHWDAAREPYAGQVGFPGQL